MKFWHLRHKFRSVSWHVVVRTTHALFSSIDRVLVRCRFSAKLIQNTVSDERCAISNDWAHESEVEMEGGVADWDGLFDRYDKVQLFPKSNDRPPRLLKSQDKDGFVSADEAGDLFIDQLRAVKIALRYFLQRNRAEDCLTLNCNINLNTLHPISTLL